MDPKKPLPASVLFCFIWVLDFSIKSYFASSQPDISWGWLHLSYTENHGIILGNLQDLPWVLRTVFLSTLGIALVAAWPLMFSLYHFHENKAVLGLNLTLAGILGNVTDRIFYGHVIDYFFLEFGSFSTPVMNFADMVQWPGYLLLMLGLYHEMAHHHHSEDQRKGGWVNKSYQLKFSLLLLAMTLSVTATLLAFGFTFLKFGLVEIGTSQGVVSHYLKVYIFSSVVLTVLFSLASLLIGKILSHRIAGPAYAIKRYVQDTLNGKRYDLKFRKNDHLKELEAPPSELNQKLLQSSEEEIPPLPEEALKDCA